MNAAIDGVRPLTFIFVYKLSDIEFWKFNAVMLIIGIKDGFIIVIDFSD